MVDNLNSENYNNFILIVAERSKKMKTKVTTLTRRREIGYEAGITTESVVYNAFYVYFVIFLTNVVGMNPVLAGTVSLISVCVDAITDPLCGWIIDHPRFNPKTFMLIGGLTTGILLGCTFVVIDASAGAQFAYYTIVCSLMWCAYTMFCIPYYSSCAQMTDDYDKLTKIRGISSTMNAFVIYAGCAFPIVFITIFQKGGMAATTSWTAAMFCIGAISIVFGLINFFSIKDVEFIQKAVEESTDGILKTYADVIKLKPMRFFIPFIFFYLFGSAMVSANTNYLIIYVAGADPNAITKTALVTMLCFLVGSPVFTWVSTKMDRKAAITLAFGFTLVGVIIMRIHGINSIGTLYAFTAIAGVACVGFWVLFYDFSYDLIALDEYKNHKNRAGCITSFPQLIQKFGNAVGLQTIGIILSAVGYDASKTVQSAGTVVGIENISTIYFAICLAVSLICILTYPVNRKVYAKLQAANERRRNGEYDFVDPDVDHVL